MDLKSSNSSEQLIVGTGITVECFQKVGNINDMSHKIKNNRSIKQQMKKLSWFQALFDLVECMSALTSASLKSKFKYNLTE